MQKNQAVTKEWKSKGSNLKCEEVQLLRHKAPGDPERSSRKEAACCRPSAPVNTLELQLEGGGVVVGAWGWPGVSARGYRGVSTPCWIWQAALHQPPHTAAGIRNNQKLPLFYFTAQNAKEKKNCRNLYCNHIYCIH